MRKKKAQTAVEFILMLAIALTVIVSLATMNFSTLSSQNNTERAIKARDAVREIYKASELVYYEGAGAKTKVFITVPSGVTTKLDNGLIEMNVSINGITQTVARKHQFNINGTFPDEEGYYWLIVESKGSYVELSY